MKYFSSILAFVMVLSLLTPFSVSAAKPSQTKPFKPSGQSESTMQLKSAIAEQLNVLEGKPQLHEALLGLSGQQEVNVIVHLSEKPVALEQGISELAGKTFTSAQAAQVEADVKAQQTLVKKELSTKGISIKQGYTFDTVLNGFAATVKANDLKKLLTVNGVTLVEPDTTVYAMEDPKTTATTTSSDLIKEDDQLEAAMNTSLSFLGIERLWNEGLKGEGIKVAVLDTGIDKHHPEFAGIFKGGKNFIPNSSTYTRNRTADDVSETLPSERPAGTPEFNANGSSFYTSHGTHVAGTIAAIGANEYGISGIAPEVDLYAYRVLGAYGSGSTSGIIAAIEEAVVQEMDIINLSLGGGANTETDSGSFAINNAMMAGTIGVLATGNSGPDRGTLGTPASARLGIGVGNSTNPETMHNGKINVTVGSYNLSKQLQLMGTTFGENVATQLQGNFDLVAVPGNGTPANYAGLDVEGKVVLVSRGEIAFVDKIAAAKANGAVGMLIHNFAGGTNAPNESGTFLGDSFAFIPTFDVSQTDGDAIRAALAGTAGTISFGNFGSENTAGDEVNDSSSRGPSTPNFDIKPDVTAPGTNIMSSIAMYKEDFPDVSYDEAYDRYTGTSMATPHIAGIAALVQQANPDWSAFDVKVALSNTAKVLDTEEYDVFSQGAGRVDAYAAAHPDALAYAIDEAVLDASGEVVENLKGTVTFGPQSTEEAVSVTKQIIVKNVEGDGGAYEVTVDVTKSYGDAKVTVDKPSFTLNGEQLLNVTLTASAGEAPAGSELLGYIHITGGDTEISLPFAADFGGEAAGAAIQNMSITETDLSFNGDGVQDKAVLSFDLTGDVATNYIELWDIMNPEGGEYGDGYIGYIHAGSALGAGSYTLNVAGQYRPWSGEPATTIPDGLYTIDFTGLAAEGIIGDYVGPVVVKTTKPSITGAVTSGQATGQVTDKYLDYNEELWYYGLEYDLNEKLFASYVVTEDGVAGQAVSFDLDQDGTFAFPVSALNAETDSVKVIIEDAAGNVGEKVIFGEAGPVDPEEPVDPELPIEVTPVTPIPSEPIGSNPHVASFGFDSIAISPNGDGVMDSTEFSFEFKELPQYPVGVFVKDPAEFTGVPDEYGDIGTIHWDPNEPQVGTGTFDGSYEDPDGVADELNDGVYGMELYSTNEVEEMIALQEPIFVKSTDPVITGEDATEVEGTEFTLDGTVEDQFFDFESTLVADYGVTNFDVNNYLYGSYVVQNNDTTVDEGTFSVNADGTYSIDLTNLEKGQTYKVYVIVQDIAGNTAVETNTVTTVAAPEAEVSLSVDQTELALTTGDTATLTVTQTTTVEGEATDEDVTAEATYTVANEEVVTVSEGVITAVAEGTTTITVSYGENEVTVEVTVTDEVVVPEPVVTLSVDKTELDLTTGDTDTLTVTQTTTPAEGEATDVDVTADATYSVANEEVATVSEGVVTAVAEGTTTITVSYGENEVTVEVTVTDEVVVPEPVVTLTVDKTNINLTTGFNSQITVKEVTTPEDGEATEKDVTKEATYAVADDKVATVTEGLVSAKAKGTTTVTVSYGGKEVTVNVTVVNPVVVNPPVDPPVDPTPVDPKPVTPPVFSDITNIFAKEEINILAAKGIIQGKTETKFAPNAQITRAEFAVLLARALDLPLNAYEGTFNDVDTSKKWAFAAIEAAAKAGIVNGTTDGSFNPDAPIKREEIAAMVVRAVEYQDKTKLDNLETPANFKDHGSIGSFAIESVYKATALGVILGNEGQFNPKNNATRAEAAVMLYRALDKLELLK